MGLTGKKTPGLTGTGKKSREFDGYTTNVLTSPDGSLIETSS
jgi:hypothetical protein